MVWSLYPLPRGSGFRSGNFATRWLSSRPAECKPARDRSALDGLLKVAHGSFGESLFEKELANLGVGRADQREHGFDAVLFGGGGEFLQQFGADSVAAIGGVDADDLDPGHGSGQAEFHLPGAAKHEAHHAIVRLRHQRGPVGPYGFGNLHSLLPIILARHAGVAVLDIDDSGQVLHPRGPDENGFGHGWHFLSGRNGEYSTPLPGTCSGILWIAALPLHRGSSRV